VPTNSDDDHQLSSSSDDSGGDGLLGRGDSRLQPWLHVHCLVSSMDHTRELWYSLPPHGGGASWLPAGQQRLMLEVTGATVGSASVAPPRPPSLKD
jgi:hypothetical protein